MDVGNSSQRDLHNWDDDLQVTILHKMDVLFFNYFFSIFAYVRYASGLLKEGTQLLHWLTLILIGTIITIGFFIWQVKAWVKGTYFKNLVKFKMCTRDMDESVPRKVLSRTSLTLIMTRAECWVIVSSLAIIVNIKQVKGCLKKQMSNLLWPP